MILNVNKRFLINFFFINSVVLKPRGFCSSGTRVRTIGIPTEVKTRKLFGGRHTRQRTARRLKSKGDEK